MNSKLPTVAIQTENGPVLINASDFDPEVHEAVDGSEEPANEPASEPATEPANEPANEPVKMLVSKEGRKHFIVGEDGKKISADGIDEKGYGFEADAWAVIMALNTSN